VELDGQVEGGLRRLCDAVAVAAQPGGLGPGRRDRLDVLQEVGELRQRPGAGERIGRARVAAPAGTMPSVTPAWMRGTAEVRASPSTTTAVSAASVQCP
jgi:hypothetical protein